MAVSADAKGRSVKTFYVGQRLVRIRIEPKGMKEQKPAAPEVPKPAEAPKPAAPVIAEEIRKQGEVEAKPIKIAPAPAAPAAPAAAEIKTTATVECPACNKAFDVPVDAKEGLCPHCGAELLFEDVVEEPKKAKKEKGEGFVFWKKKPAA